MAESPIPQKQPSLKERLALRTGPCSAVVRSTGVCRCDQFACEEYVDGFQTCKCGHTQWSHEPTGAPK